MCQTVKKKEELVLHKMNRRKDKWKEVAALSAIQAGVKTYIRDLKCNEPVQNSRNAHNLTLTK